MLFASFFSAYVVRKGVTNYDYAARGYSTEWQSFKLPAVMLGIATASLLLAGVALEIARRKALRAVTQPQTGYARNGVWMWSSIIATAGYLVFVAGAWQVLGSKGHRLNSGAQAAFFYLLTGVHSLHVAIVLLFLLYVSLRRSWRTDDRAIVLDLSAWYCYSMGALWLCMIFLFLI
jgi:cytochrome c oxidase subunit 3